MVKIIWKQDIYDKYDMYNTSSFLSAIFILTLAQWKFFSTWMSKLAQINSTYRH